MDGMIYVAMSAARETMHRQSTNNHNLANANTTGFKAVVDAFEATPVHGAGHPSRAFTQDRGVGNDLSTGSLTATGNPLDVAIDGKGFLLVQDPLGREVMTRNGDLKVGAGGLLETGTGDLVLGDGGPIAISPHESLTIGGDGTLSIRPAGQGPEALVVLDRLRLVKPDPANVMRNDRGHFITKDGSAPPADASVTLASETLETSNVDPVGAMVTMIELARQYEANVKLMKSVEDNDSASTKLLQFA